MILTLLQAIAEVLHAADSVDDIVVGLVDTPANSIIQTDSSRAIRLLTNVKTGRLSQSICNRSALIVLIICDMNVLSGLLRIVVTHEISSCWPCWPNHRTWTRRPNLSGRKVMTDVDVFFPDVIAFLLHKRILLLPQRVLSLVFD